MFVYHQTVDWLRPVWMTNHPLSVLWHCWLGHQTCKNRRPYNLYCVGADVKPCSINHQIAVLLLSFRDGWFGSCSLSDDDAAKQTLLGGCLGVAAAISGLFLCYVWCYGILILEIYPGDGPPTNRPTTAGNQYLGPSCPRSQTGYLGIEVPILFQMTVLPSFVVKVIILF